MDALPDAPSNSKLPKARGNGNGQDVGKETEKTLTGDLDMSVFALDDEDEDREKGKRKGGLEDESREAQEIVRRMLDEVNLERGNKARPEYAGSGKEGEEDELVLPSAPSTLPEPETGMSSSPQVLRLQIWG